MNWKTKRLADLITLERGFDLPKAARIPGNVPVISSGKIEGTHNKAKIKGPGFAIGRATNLGRPRWSDIDYWPLNTTLYAKDFHGNNPRWLYYLFMVMDLSGYDSGSVQPMLNRNYISEIPIQVPSIKEQDSIVSCISALDDKIAVNNKIIKLSLKLAKLLPQCVQQEQQKYKLSEISNLISRGITPKYVEDGFTVLNQKCIRNNLVDLNQARQASNLPKNHERILQQYDVLVNSTGYGTLGRISPWLHETAQLKTVITDTHITTIRFDDQKVDPAFAAMVLSTQENAVANLAEGSTGQTELKRELIENFEIMLPPFAIQHEVSQQIRPLLLAVMTLRNENQTLARTRDELLPLLMSGKITVRDAEEASAEVGVDKHEVEE